LVSVFRCWFVPARSINLLHSGSGSGGGRAAKGRGSGRAASGSGSVPDTCGGIVERLLGGPNHRRKRGRLHAVQETIGLLRRVLRFG
jgi:hypothetical protein